MYTIYSKEDCPNCDTAKKILNEKGIKFKEIKLGRDIMDRNEFIAEIMDKSGIMPRAVPQIFFDEKYLGNLDQFLEHIK